MLAYDLNSEEVYDQQYLTEQGLIVCERDNEIVQFLSKNTKNSSDSQNSGFEKNDQAIHQASNILEFKRKNPNAAKSENNRSRYYNPYTGRFLSEDPISIAGGDLSLMRYAANNPINYNDPSGLFAVAALPVVFPILIPPALPIIIVGIGIGVSIWAGSELGEILKNKFQNAYSKNHEENRQARDFSKKFGKTKVEERRIRKLIEDLSIEGDFNLVLISKRET